MIRARKGQALAPSNTIYQTLPSPADGVEVVYTKDPVETEAWLRNNVTDKGVDAVGFDIEWKPQFKKKKHGGVENKTAVLQLAMENSVLVLHLHHMVTIPKLLRDVLKNGDIKKVGSGILQDMFKLKRDKGIECAGRVDTQTMAQSLGVSRAEGVGLQKLSQRFLGVQLNKPKRVSMSNWEVFPLSYSQIEYAGMDAWIGLKLYHRMNELAGGGTVASRYTTSTPLNSQKTTPFASKPEKHQIEESKRQEEQQSVACCGTCGKKFQAAALLAKHVKSKHLHVTCHNCGKKFHHKIPKKHRKLCFKRFVLNMVMSSPSAADTPWL